jgi:solute carrier family 32 (vesicular inhibitory amino acid transporter)
MADEEEEPFLDPEEQLDPHPPSSSWPRTVETAMEWQAGTAPGAQAGLIEALSRSAQPSLRAAARIGTRLRRISGAGGAGGEEGDDEEQPPPASPAAAAAAHAAGFGSGIEEEAEGQEQDDDSDTEGADADFFPGGFEDSSASLARPLLVVPPPPLPPSCALPDGGRRRSLLLERGHKPGLDAQQSQQQQQRRQSADLAAEDDAALFPALREASLPAGTSAGTSAGLPPQPVPIRLVLEEADRSGSSSTFAAGLNAVNVLCGVGLLAMPFASAQAGWVSFLLLAAVAGVALFSGTLLEACMSLGSGPPPPLGGVGVAAGRCGGGGGGGGGGNRNSTLRAARPSRQPPPLLRSFPDLGGAAFGRTGRVLVACLLYLELLSCVADFLILEGDNLAALLPALPPSPSSSFALTPEQAWALAAAVMVLPTVLLRDLSALSYLSAGGIGGSVAIVGCVVSSAVRAASAGPATAGPAAAAASPAAAAAAAAIQTAAAAITATPATATTRPWLPRLPLARPAGLPVALGLYSFSFSGAACFPSIYVSMRDRRHFRPLLAGAFTAVALLYGAAALAGLSAFGSGVRDQVTLSMGSATVEGRLAAWLVVVSPLTKIALTLAPVALAVEEMVLSPPRARGEPRRRGRASANALKSAALRVALLGGCAAAAVSVPFFALFSQIIGAFMCLNIAVVLPALFFVRLRRRHAPRWQLCCAVAVALVAEAGSVGATAHALAALWDKLKSRND